MLLTLSLLLAQASAALPPDAGGPPSPTKGRDTFVPEAERAAEIVWLTSLGLSVPDAGVVLAAPYAPPLTKRSFVVPHTWFEDSPDTVSAAALAEDLDVLKEAMSRAHGGWDTAEARGWKWHAWFSEWRTMLLAHGNATLPLETAFAPVQRLMEFQPDNHTNIPLSPRTYFSSGSTTVLLAASPKGPCAEARTAAGHTFQLLPSDPGQQVRRAQAWDGSGLHPQPYLSYPVSRGQVTEVRCGQAWVKAHPVWEPAPLDAFHENPKRTQALLALSKETRDHPFHIRLTPRTDCGPPSKTAPRTMAPRASTPPSAGDTPRSLRATSSLPCRRGWWVSCKKCSMPSTHRPSPAARGAATRSKAPGTTPSATRLHPGRCRDAGAFSRSSTMAVAATAS